MRVVQRIDPGERQLTAIHEAGHAVAAVLRGGTFDVISIEPTVTRDGFIRTREVAACDYPFVIFAGPWAEARVQWPARPLDGVDDDGRTFGQYVEDALLSNASDLRVYEPDTDIAFEHLCADMFDDGPPPPVPGPRDPSWNDELETCWPTIQWAADMLMNEVEVTPEAVARRLPKCDTKAAEAIV